MEHLFNFCQLYCKDENKEKDAGNGPLKRVINDYFSSYRKTHFGSMKSQIQFSEISSVLQKRRSKKKGLMKCERVYGNK